MLCFLEKNTWRLFSRRAASQVHMSYSTANLSTLAWAHPQSWPVFDLLPSLWPGREGKMRMTRQAFPRSYFHLKNSPWTVSSISGMETLNQSQWFLRISWRAIGQIWDLSSHLLTFKSKRGVFFYVLILVLKGNFRNITKIQLIWNLHENILKPVI